MKTIVDNGASTKLRERLELSFSIENSAQSKTVQALVDGALAGSFKPGSAARLQQIAAKARAVVA